MYSWNGVINSVELYSISIVRSLAVLCIRSVEWTWTLEYVLRFVFFFFFVFILDIWVLSAHSTRQHSYCSYCILINFPSSMHFVRVLFWFDSDFDFVVHFFFTTYFSAACCCLLRSFVQFVICVSGLPLGDWWLFCILWRVFVFIIMGAGFYWLLLASTFLLSFFFPSQFYVLQFFLLISNEFICERLNGVRVRIPRLMP